MVSNTYPEYKSIKQHRNKMETLKIEIGKVSDHLYSLMTQTKARKISAGFIKKDGSYREGTFDLKDRKTWKQTDGTMYQRKG